MGARWRSGGQRDSVQLRLGTALFFSLLVASLAVAVLVVRARTPDLVLEVTAIDPRERTISPSGGDPARARITFFVRESEPRAEVAIVDSREHAVRILDREVPLTAGNRVEYVWDGRDAAGRPVEPGRYRLMVSLPEHDRTMIWPRRITVLPGSGDDTGESR